MAERQLMKDGLDFEAVRRISTGLKRCYPAFDKTSFEHAAQDGLDELELKERVKHVMAALAQCLPADFEKAARILEGLPETWPKGREGDPLAGFAAWPVIDYAGAFGIEEPDVALPLLRRLTHLFSAEFAIRPFLLRHPEVTMTYLEGWVYDDDPHVRRLVSEGTRPRLPWGQRLPAFIQDPNPVLELLEELKDDTEEYVRKSVANNLNDISKDHPETVVKTCARWLDAGGDETPRIVRHGLRTLVKEGHREALALLGFDDAPVVTLEDFKLAPRQLELGGNLRFSFRLVSHAAKSQRIVVDYAIQFVKAGGKTSEKVFKLRALELSPGESKEVTKLHSFKPVTTRRYYSGEHAVQVLVNGRVLSRGEFELLVPEAL